MHGISRLREGIKEAGAEIIGTEESRDNGEALLLEVKQLVMWLLIAGSSTVLVWATEKQGGQTGSAGCL